MQHQRGTAQQLQITPEYLNQQILALTQQVQALQGQVNSLRSVVLLSPNGVTIQAEHLTLNAGKTLTMSSGKETSLTSNDNLSLTSAKTLALQGGHDITAEGAAGLKLKAPQIKFNGGTKPIALKDSPVAGGKVIAGSATVFAN
ncbi:MAG: hypothetical protein WD425_21285 [Nitrospirales bacterium]